MNNLLIVLFIFLISSSSFAQSNPTILDSEPYIKKYEDKVITWRRHLHQNPELSNREFNTAAYIVEQLKPLGFAIETGVAHTGVVAVLDTKRPGPTIGLRADMDALPMTERVDLPFASKVQSEYLGEKVGVMHACGHDAHVAILLGVAHVLKDIQKSLTGKIVFVFQPAEEGAPKGEEGGAELMIKEGLMEKYGIEVMFGLHISSVWEEGKIFYKAMGAMAAADQFEITIKGKQTHGARPWDGVDPITIAAQVTLGLQNIIARQTDLTKAPAIITVGKISGGVRHNIIPESVEMYGTIRTFDTLMQNEIHRRIERTAKRIAESAGGEAIVDIYKMYPVTYNDPELTAKMISSLERAAGEQNVIVMVPMTIAEDFSFYAQKVPALFYFLGARPREIDTIDASLHHTPDFYIDEKSFPLGVRSMVQLVIDYQQ